MLRSLLVHMSSLLALAGCRPAATPVSAQKIGNRMAAILTVLSPMVDQARGLGVSARETNEAIRAFNEARDSALLVVTTGRLVMDAIDEFVVSAQAVLRLISPTLCAYTDVSAEHMRELYTAVRLLPALVDDPSPAPESRPMLIVPSPKTTP